MIGTCLQLATLGALLHPRPFAPHASRRGTACACAGAEVQVTSDGGVRKQVLQPAPEGAVLPEWGSLVRVGYTGSFENGTSFEVHTVDAPFEFQLNTGQVIDGLARGVATMRVGERARLTCAPDWAHGSLGLPPHIPGNATLCYDIELVDTAEGPVVENDDFDMHVYKNALEGKESGRGRTSGYRWAEGGEEVTLWVPLPPGMGARDVRCDFGTRELRVSVGDEGGPYVGGALKGRVMCEDCYWVIEDEEESDDGQRAVQVVLAKANSFTRWDGVIVGEQQQEQELVPADMDTSGGGAGLMDSFLDGGSGGFGI